MTGELHPFLPDWTISPGTILHEELKARGMTPGALALLAGLAEEVVQGILDAAVEVDQTLADGLFAALGISARFWLNAERIYRQALARGAKDCSSDYA